LLARSGDVPRAEAVLREQLSAAPQDRQAASSLIQALLLQGDVEGAEVQARTMLDLGDETGLAEFQLGRVLQAKKSSQEAIDAYKAALEKSPQAPEPLQGLVAILVTEDRADEAIAFLRTHLDQYPTQLPPRLLLAAVYAKQGKTGAAAELYEEIISLQPNAAIKIYETLVANNANNIIAVNNLAALMLDYRSDTESHARALELAKQFEDSDQAALLDTLGWAYYRNGDYDNAVRLLDAAVAGNDQMALLRYHLGMALVKANIPERGRAELEKSIDMAAEDFPGIEEARATLAEL